MNNFLCLTKYLNTLWNNIIMSEVGSRLPSNKKKLFY